MKAITPIELRGLTEGFNKNGAIYELGEKINEIVERLNYITTHGVPERRFKAGLPFPQRDDK